MAKIRLRKHRTAKLETIIGSDLLTAREKFVKNEIGGLYKLADELAYTKGHEDKSAMTVPEFERYLKKNINQHFTVVYNPIINPEHKVEGHSIYYFIPAWESFIPICKVGKSGDNLLPANSQGAIVKYQGKNFKQSGGDFFDEEAILWRGWVAAFEACKAAWNQWQDEGIVQARAISLKEAYAMKKAYAIIGFSDSATGHVERLESAVVVENKIKEELEKPITEESSVDTPVIEDIKKEDIKES